MLVNVNVSFYYLLLIKYKISDQARLGVWILDGDTQHTNLLKYALTEENFAHTLVLLVVSMAQPWNIMDSLQKWITVLRQHIEKLKIPKETLREYEQSCKYFSFFYFLLPFLHFNISCIISDD